MPLVTSTSARRAYLARIVPYLKTHVLRLFANDFDPLPTSLATDFLDPAFDTYAPIVLSQWCWPYLNPELRAETDEVPRTWTVGPLGGVGVVWGVWATDPDGTFLWAERFAAGSVPMDAPGLTVSYLPRFLSGPLA